MTVIPCNKCGKPMPELRKSKYGYKVCTLCSNERPVGCVDTINHKTGNSIEIVPEDVAIRARKAMYRQGYGVCNGMKHSVN